MFQNQGNKLKCKNVKNEDDIHYKTTQKYVKWNILEELIIAFPNFIMLEFKKIKLKCKLDLIKDNFKQQIKSTIKT